MSQTGCVTVGPDYVRPEVKLDDAWHNGADSNLAGNTSGYQSVLQWWQAIDDSLLAGLMNRALANSNDLQEAKARVRQARALRGVTQSGYYPSVTTGGSADWNRTGKTKGTGIDGSSAMADFDASWELDLFGGVRRSVEAKTADMQAAEENLHDVQITLLAETALNYIDVRTYQERIRLAESNLSLQTETWQLAQWQNQAGLSDELAVQQARYSLESTRSSIPGIRTSLEAAMNRIEVLLGEQPGRLHDALSISRPLPVINTNPETGVPADLIRRRPDVRRAERQLASQTAQIGVAKAELYPKFSLGGSIGVNAPSVEKLFSSATWIFSGGPQFSWSIFKAGAIQNNIDAQYAARDQYLYAYKSTVLSAVEEVENAITAYAQEQQRRQSLSNAADAARKAGELARQKYQAGLTDFSAILDAQRSLVSFEDQLAQSSGTLAADLIRLYKALGGGWETLAIEENQ
jgi:NodT family efflux transporter outer membrane factor (OMF) lipoprotein